MRQGMWVAVVVLVFFCGCAAMLTNDSSKNFSKHTVSGEGVVVGKLDSSYPLNLNINVRNVDTGKTFTIINDAILKPGKKRRYVEKLFCVQLPAGQYIAEGLEASNIMYTADPIALNIPFKVLPQEVRYIGTLNLSAEDMTFSGSSKQMRLFFLFKREYLTAQRMLKQECPWLTGEKLVDGSAQ